jgi:chloramphenicol-sensitive protein RarD
MPALFLLMGRVGATPWEILAQRALWSAPWALGLVLIAGQAPEVRAILARPRVLATLGLSGLLIGLNWSLYVWAVANGHVLDGSLGYYINPLLNMAVGAALFRERIDRFGAAAMALAAAGVVVQTAAIGHLPYISLALALTFTTYGVIRKQVDASAQAGLLVESLFILAPGAAYVGWLLTHGAGVFGHGVGGSLLMALTGPITVIPLALFSWAARRLTFATFGFLQFIGPTMGFVTGVANGEPLSPLRAASFGLIWGGAAVFAWGAWRAGRRLKLALAGA